MNFIKKHWKIICIISIIAFPFVLELFLNVTPIVSRFSNETWFSFIGSYVGAIATVVVMFITFKKSDDENKKILNKQKEKYRIDLEKEKLKRIIHVLLLDDYYFLSLDTVSENLDRFRKDLSYVQFDTLEFGFGEKNEEILFQALLDLQKEEVRILETIPHVKTKDELNIVQVDAGLELNKVVNLRRASIKAMYDDYFKKKYEKYYE